MAKIQPVWALDIGQAALKALKLVPGESPDTVEAVAFDYVEHPKILSQPDADPDALVREALATFMDRNDLKGCKVAIAVPGQAGLVKFIKLPPVEKKRIPDIVKFEAKQQIPFALEEVIWAYQQIGDDEEGGDDDFTMAEVGLFAMKRDQINRAILPYRASGIEVDIVQMGPIALYNFIAADQLKGSDIKGSVVLIDVGADHTDLIITDGTRIWQRNVPIGGNHFTRALTKELKLTFAKAEHLKRNATKAPDPKAVFTAMRGVFNDFASEINRSIGFYTSVNRSAKIVKVVGLGNGFKLPGLQKFLQQNLNGLDVEKCDKFQKLVGDEVITAPQFHENLASFAVAYGLALQGIGKAPVKTNLLPPEIEQVRLIRAKKPWVLAASALIMLGLSMMFFSDYRALAKVNTPEFKSAVSSADSASNSGASFKSAYDAAKGEWDAKYKEGQSLIIDPSDRAKWPKFLQMINVYFPDPVKQYKLDPKNPKDVPIIESLRVHIDRISPVWTDNVATTWFDVLPENFKNLMHPYDRNTPPTGEGWVIQIIGHHYNPQPDTEELRKPELQRTKFGPINYLIQKVLPGLEVPSVRLQGVHHVALGWMMIDKAWTSDKGAAGNGVAAAAPLLPRATAPAGTGGEGGGGGMGGYSSDMVAMMKSMMGGGGSGGGLGKGYGSGGGMNPMDMMRAMGSAMGGPMGQPNDPNAPKVTKLTRTDFLIQFVWQPPVADTTTAEAKTEAEKYQEIVKLLKDAEADAKSKGAIKIPSEDEVVAASKEKSDKVIEATKKAVQEIEAKSKAAGSATPGAAPSSSGSSAPPTPTSAPAGVADPGAPVGKPAAAPTPTAPVDPGAPAAKK